jgi:hypothetical protein
VLTRVEPREILHFVQDDWFLTSFSAFNLFSSPENVFAIAEGFLPRLKSNHFAPKVAGLGCTEGRMRRRIERTSPSCKQHLNHEAG